MGKAASFSVGLLLGLAIGLSADGSYAQQEPWPTEQPIVMLDGK